MANPRKAPVAKKVETPIVEDLPTAEIVDEGPIVYNPQKQYGWGNETQFILNGQEFGVIINALRAVVSTPEAQIILAANRGAQVIEKLMAESVEKGFAKEVK